MNEFIDIYDEILDKLKNDEKFQFVRYGDGEWALILNTNIKTDWHYKNLIKKWGDSIQPFCKTLKDIVESKPEYFFGVQDLAYKHWKDEIDTLTVDLNVVKADIFHTRSLKNEIDDFFKTLSEKKVVVVGPDYLKEIKLFDISHHIVTPEYHVWNSINEIEILIRDFIDRNTDRNLIFIYACSIATKILIHKFSNEDITQIDVGSLLDPYVGVFSRNYHKQVLDRLNIKESTFKYPKIK